MPFILSRPKSGLVCSDPFEQAQLNSYLARMLGNLDTADWSKNGLEYGRQDELYSQASAVAELYRRVFGQKSLGRSICSI